MSGELILVTGVTGYIGAWTAEELLKKGYRVRGTSRSVEKADFLKQRWSQYGDKFEVVEVKDLVQDGAFDKAVAGVDGIMHIASPFHFNVQDPYKDLIDPAVKGTKSLLEAAHKHGDKVKRVIVTSSFAAMMEPHDAGYEFTEEDWNHDSINHLDNPMHAYLASKSEAEKAAWKFIETEKPKFELAVINPVYVFGPYIHQVKDAESINTSVGLVFNYLSGNATDVQVNQPTDPTFYVDVRDIAEAHIKAYEVKEAAGQRFICTGGPFTYQQIADVLRKEYPELKDIPEGQPGKNYEVGVKASNERAKKVLGINFISLEQSIKDTAVDLKKQFL
ncbi:D-lactaldehyde dehydrogenase [Saitoella complicata NRRL Y-17804]|uniref:D-lactaldehyde dehydrogenase n=1 Tax=Saitoella complicata (strain BCRC 22490 / CBS 7301 / JCM 7358 / NBRC 10748 / NRRL Y-17804) TaxID=698492 RepID=UPI000866BB8E|nr:D-lactaldehyde dehydrogenase [Saitoella complicata NRRL Y-17804]ODQ50515.1 D-lactaldehyde dehydrogenase [Saitoella complicata NRRL Y-17804]